MTPPVFSRSSGVLLHVTSLPGPYGIGDLGPAAHRWIDWLADSNTRYWQLLPIGPTGFGESPYSSPSSRAGNTDLISPEALVVDGLIPRSELRPTGALDQVDYPAVRTYKEGLLRAAFANLAGRLSSQFADFAEREAGWVDPFGLYMSLKRAGGDASWTSWPESIRQRDPAAIAEVRRRFANEIEFHVFCQFLFHRQLEEVRRHARERGVAIIGDVPLYVAPDSVDVWLNPELFTLDETGEPSHVAGVPPDMFSASGQRWGNPLYRWDLHREDGFSWWAERLRGLFGQSDVLRIDHFTGLATYYEIPASDPTAIGGTWREGPGVEFFERLEEALGPLQVVVEDMGPAGQVVEDLRMELGYPGMIVVQEFFVEEGPYDEVETDRVVFTGTHDNDTARGRFDSESSAYRRRALEFSGDDEVSYPRGLLDAVWASSGVIAVAPMQDLLGLGTEARMNLPATTSGNWQWRMTPGSATDELSAKLLGLNQRHRRNT